MYLLNKTQQRFTVRHLVAFNVVLFLFPVNAYAYLDLGSGSFMTQMMIAFALGGLYKVKVVRKKLLSLFKNLVFKSHQYR